MRSLHRFPGGLKLEGHKSISTRHPIRTIPLAPQLVVPLRQHIGELPKVEVQVGQAVLKGDRLAQYSGYVSAPIHAPTSGVVSAIEDRPIPHPSGLSARCVVIDSDGQDRWCDTQPNEDFASIDPQELRQTIRSKGIVGMGGAGFPTAVKLTPRAGHALDALILNGAECEPFITCDDMLMRERTREVLIGLNIMRRTVDARECIIAIEDNKPEAIAAMREIVSGLTCDVEVVELPTRYPMGAEKQLIYTLTGKEVPRDGIPAHVGVVCQNPGTAYAVYNAVVHDRPLLSRIVTVTGGAVPDPCNYEVPIGTPMRFLLEQAGVAPDRVDRLDQLIMGGPMMGIKVANPDVPVIKTCNCLMARTAEERPPAVRVLPCIRCGACAQHCPASLLPQQLYWYARAKELDKVQDYELFDCIECGVCTAVCPSKIPLVEFFRYAKTAIYNQEREKQVADQARRRHEARLERQEREKRERQQRLQKKKASVTGKGSVAEAKKKAIIEAAMARAKAKRETAEPRNTDNLTPDQQAKIEAVDRRRARAKVEAAKGPPGKPAAPTTTSDGEPPPGPSEPPAAP